MAATGPDCPRGSGQVQILSARPLNCLVRGILVGSEWLAWNIRGTSARRARYSCSAERRSGPHLLNRLRPVLELRPTRTLTCRVTGVCPPLMRVVGRGRCKGLETSSTRDSSRAHRGRSRDVGSRAQSKRLALGNVTVRLALSWLKLVPCSTVDLVEGGADVVGQGLFGGEGVVAGVDLDGAVAA